MKRTISTFKIGLKLVFCDSGLLQDCLNAPYDVLIGFKCVTKMHRLGKKFKTRFEISVKRTISTSEIGLKLVFYDGGLLQDCLIAPHDSLVGTKNVWIYK